MDRRNKVWLILLAALLIAAVAAVVVVNDRLSDSREQLVAANAQLTSAQERNEALSADIESANAELAAATESSAALEAQLSESQTAKTELEAQLTDAQTAKTELETQLADAQTAQTELEAQLTESETAQTELKAQLTDAQAAQTELEAQLTDAQAAQTELEAQLTDAQAAQTELEAQLTDAQAAKAELEAQLAGQSEAPAPIEEAAVPGDEEPAPNEEPAAEAGTPALELPAAEAAAAIGERIEAVKASGDEARQRAEALSGVLAAVESGILEVTGEPAPAAEAGEPMTVVPEVRVPEILAQTEGLDVAELQGRVDAILSAGEDEMTQEEKAAALTELRAEVSGYVSGLNAAVEDLATQQTALEAAGGAAEALEQELAEARATVDSLNADIEESKAAVAALEAQVAELSGKSETDAAAIEALNAQIAAEQARGEELTAQLSAALAERDRYQEALDAYRIARAPGEGQAHVASTLGSRIAVAADGVSASWNYVNNSASGNAVVLSIELDGAEIYRSESIAPGASLGSFALEGALEPGSYEAVAVVSVLNADGSAASATRVPVTLVVG